MRKLNKRIIRAWIVCHSNDVIERSQDRHLSWGSQWLTAIVVFFDGVLLLHVDSL